MIRVRKNRVVIVIRICVYIYNRYKHRWIYTYIYAYVYIYVYVKCRLPYCCFPPVQRQSLNATSAQILCPQRRKRPRGLTLWKHLKALSDPTNTPRPRPPWTLADGPLMYVGPLKSAKLIAYWAVVRMR